MGKIKKDFFANAEANSSSKNDSNNYDNNDGSNDFDNSQSKSNNDSDCRRNDGRCKVRKFHNKHSSRRETVYDHRQKVVHEHIKNVHHIDKVYIQPVRRTVHTKKTIVYKLPTKHYDDGCTDHGVKWVGCSKDMSN